MATKGAIGTTRDQAVRRMQAAMTRISAGTGIEAALFPFFRQPDYQAAATLDVLAGYFERVAEFLAPEPKRGSSRVEGGGSVISPNRIQSVEYDADGNIVAATLEYDLPDYSVMTRADVLKRAEEAGMLVSKTTTKGEGVDFLMAAAGISEDEQQALDTDGGGAVEG